jgi:hypothetical protein
MNIPALSIPPNTPKDPDSDFQSTPMDPDQDSDQQSSSESSSNDSDTEPPFKKSHQYPYNFNTLLKQRQTTTQGPISSTDPDLYFRNGIWNQSSLL